MSIEISDMAAFIAATKVVSKDTSRRHICGIRIEPDGRVTGTDTTILISGESVEPFEGEAFTLHLFTTLPVTAVGGRIDTERKVLILDMPRGKEKVIPYATFADTYPKYRRFINESMGRWKNTALPKLNLSHETVLELMRALPKGSFFTIEFGRNEQDILHVVCHSIPDTTIILMPASIPEH